MRHRESVGVTVFCPANTPVSYYHNWILDKHRYGPRGYGYLLIIYPHKIITVRHSRLHKVLVKIAGHVFFVIRIF